MLDLLVCPLLSCLTCHYGGLCGANFCVNYVSFSLPMFECSMFSGSPEWIVGGARRRLGGRKWRERRHQQQRQSLCRCTQTSMADQLAIFFEAPKYMAKYMADQLAIINP